MKRNFYPTVWLILLSFFVSQRSAAFFQTTKSQFTPPPAPVIVEPAGARNVNPLLIKVAVSEVPNARRYTLQINKRSDFKGPSITVSGMQDQKQFILKDFEASTTYYVRAKSDYSAHYGPVASFRTREAIKPKRLWGVTTSGGEHAAGTIFSFSIDSARFTKHHDYVETSDYPYAYLRGSLIPAPDGGFYGNSECEKNGTCANGEVFYVSPKGEYELRYSLGMHAGSVMLASNNNLFVVDDWINLFRGGIWKLDAAGTGSFPLENIVYKFRKDTQGLNPRQPLLELSDGFLYGMTPYGGTDNAGTIFRIDRNGKRYEVLHRFDGHASGANPNGSLILGEDGYLYGTTAMGGTFDLGVLFQFDPAGKVYKKLFEFRGLNGKHPMGNVLYDGGFLYGMTQAGGNHDKGVLFSVRADGLAFKKLLDFNGDNGAHPMGTPVIDDKKMLYAMTSQGGKHNRGVIFKIRATGTSFSRLFDFSEAMGGNPDGSLLFMEDSFRPDKSTEAPLAGASSEVGLYPNPFVTSISARIAGKQEQPVKFILTDLRGNVLQEVLGVTNIGLELGRELNRGIYILKVVRGESVSLHRIVKK